MGQVLFQMIPFLVIFAIFYFLLIKPAKKKQQAHEELLKALNKGDKVITNGGLYGEVAKVEGELVLLKLADNVKVRISKQGIAGLEGAPVEKGAGS
jgi:preprotein translocase subunit YajC